MGPGAGRPSKLYRPASTEVTASVPARRYDLAGSLLATAVAEATRTGADVGECLRIAAGAAGRAIGEEASEAVAQSSSASDRRQAAIEVLARHGYEPVMPRRNEIALANCPFHALVDEQRDLVCGMNRDLLCGMADAVGEDVLAARLAPSEGSCCVRLDIKQRAPKDR